MTPISETPRSATLTTSRHPNEDEIPQRYAVNAFDMAVRSLDCGCEDDMQCEHVVAYNAARVRLLEECRPLSATPRSAESVAPRMTAMDSMHTHVLLPREKIDALIHMDASGDVSDKYEVICAMRDEMQRWLSSSPIPDGHKK